MKSAACRSVRKSSVEGGRAAQAVYSDLHSRWDKYGQTCFTDTALPAAVRATVTLGEVTSKATDIKNHVLDITG